MKENLLNELQEQINNTHSQLGLGEKWKCYRVSLIPILPLISQSMKESWLREKAQIELKQVGQNCYIRIWQSLKEDIDNTAADNVKEQWGRLQEDIYHIFKGEKELWMQILESRLEPRKRKESLYEEIESNFNKIAKKDIQTIIKLKMLDVKLLDNFKDNIASLITKDQQEFYKERADSIPLKDLKNDEIYKKIIDSFINFKDTDFAENFDNINNDIFQEMMNSSTTSETELDLSAPWDAPKEGQDSDRSDITTNTILSTDNISPMLSLNSSALLGEDNNDTVSENGCDNPSFNSN